ncbi:MAG: hypothetical protein ACLFQZ_02585 [Spirochaetaceae bacterium]
MRVPWCELLSLLLLSLSASCELLSPPEAPPCILLGASFERLYPEERHRVELHLRMRETPLPEKVSLRFEIESSPATAERDEEEVEKLSTKRKATRRVTALDPRTGVVEVTFDSPFPFLPREPMVLSTLTLLSMERNGERVWSGELIYPYQLEEQLAEPE